MRPPYADSADQVNIIINVMEAELRGLFRHTCIPLIESHFHLHQDPTSASTHNAYSSLIQYLYAPMTEHLEHAKRHLRTIVLTHLTLPPSQRLSLLPFFAIAPQFAHLETQLTAHTNTLITDTIHMQPYWFTRHEDDLTFHRPTPKLQDAPFVAPTQTHNHPTYRIPLPPTPRPNLHFHTQRLLWPHPLPLRAYDGTPRARQATPPHISAHPPHPSPSQRISELLFLEKIGLI